MNLSNNLVTSLSLTVVPQLTHLDVSNNLLSSLDLQTTRNLVELKCSGNPLANLTLKNSPNLTVFDCFGIQLAKNDATVQTATLTATQTLFTDDPIFVNSTIGLATFSGISLLGWIVLGWIFVFKRFFGRVIPTPGSS